MWGQKSAGKARQWGGGSPMWWITATFPESQDLLTLPTQVEIPSRGLTAYLICTVTAA